MPLVEGASATEAAGAELAALEARITACCLCPRLVAWREMVARQKKAAFRDWQYWGRPLPGFGDPGAGLMVVGLAPAAHGGNRTGRIFTGDRSGDWLYAALFRAGFANRPESVRRDDGLHLTGAFVSAAVRCAPPQNRPTPAERANCLPYLQREIELLQSVRVYVALGAFAYRALLEVLGLKRAPAFAHGRELALADGRTLLCSFHPSQRNTFTGKLTRPMFDAVFARARQLLAARDGQGAPATVR